MAQVLEFKSPAAGLRERLLGYCRASAFPGEQYASTEFGIPALTRESHDHLKALFTDFGVTGLDPSAPDFDTVTNTWYVLTGCVGEHLLARDQFKAAVYDVEAPNWTPEYRAYVCALWDGDTAEVRRLAEVLGIKAGIPETTPRFYRPARELA